MNPFLNKILENFELYSDDVFAEVLVDGETVTIRWKDLEKGCKRAVSVLNRLNPINADGGVVLIFLPHQPTLFPAFLGSMLGGFIPSFMPCPSPKQDANLYWQSHQTLIEKIRPIAVITTDDMFKQMIDANLDLFDSVVILDTEISNPTITENYPPISLVSFNIKSAESIALLQHSSGTTGLKKGVALSFDAIHRHAVAYGSKLELSKEDVIVSWLPLYHDMGLIACFITPCFHAVKTIQIGAFDWLNRPNLLFNSIQKFSGTLCWLPNFAFEHLTNTLGRHALRFDLSSMRAFISCSEPCKALTFDRFSEAFLPARLRPETLISCYAMAEVVFGVTQASMSDPLKRLRVDNRKLNIGDKVAESKHESTTTELIDCGKTLDGVEVVIVDKFRKPVDEGIIGEIAISSKFLFSGYYKNSELSSACLTNGLYYSNDLGFIWQERLYVLGRLDDLIIINGRNILAHQIEAIVSKISGVKAGRVVACPSYDSKIGSDTLVIMAEQDSSSIVNDSKIVTAIIRHIQSELDVVPRAVQIVKPGTLIKTSSGKISRKENQKLYQHSLESGSLKHAS